MIFTNNTDEKIGDTMLAGAQVAADNATVYDLLKSLGSSGFFASFYFTL